MRISAVCLVAIVAIVAVLSAAHADESVRPIKRFAPDYPVEALEKEIAGRVSAWLSVDEDGDVTGVEVSHESPVGFGFGDAAKEAFAQWTYPKNLPGRYKATFTFAIAPLELTDEEANLNLAAPPVSSRSPRYPAGALDAAVTGEASVVATIDEEGSVESVRIVRVSPPGFGFGESTRDAVLLYRFKPGPRSVWAQTIRYVLVGDDISPDIAMPAGDLPMAPEPSRRGSPEYPYKARKEGVEGWVDLGIQIDKRGRITHGAVMAEEPKGFGFGASAYKSLSWWRFEDTKAGTYKVRVEFKLED